MTDTGVVEERPAGHEDLPVREQGRGLGTVRTTAAGPRAGRPVLSASRAARGRRFRPAGDVGEEDRGERRRLARERAAYRDTSLTRGGIGRTVRTYRVIHDTGVS